MVKNEFVELLLVIDIIKGEDHHSHFDHLIKIVIYNHIQYFPCFNLIIIKLYCKFLAINNWVR